MNAADDDNDDDDDDDHDDDTLLPIGRREGQPAVGVGTRHGGLRRELARPYKCGSSVTLALCSQQTLDVVR